MKKFLLVGLALAAALATAQVAKADTFQITVTGTNTSDPSGTDGLGISGSGVVTGTLVGPDEFLLTSGSITVNGNTGSLISTTAPGVTEFSAGPPAVYISPDAGPNGFFFDDILLPTDPSGNYVDGNGLVFQFADDDQMSIYFDGTNDLLLGYNTSTELYNPNTASLGYDVSLSIDATPEPSSLMLLGTGLLLLAGFLFKKSKTVTVEQSMNTAV